MYALPDEIEAKPFARYPSELRTGTEASAWNRMQPAGIASTSFLEGPCYDRNGQLWCVDVVNGRILTVTESGRFNVELEYDGWPNGLKVRDNGDILIADHRIGLVSYTPGAEEVTPIVSSWDGSPFLGTNDLTFSVEDTYFTDQGRTGLQDPGGRLFRLRPEGTLECLLSTVPSPNGLVVAPDGNTLFLAVTRANAIWRVPVVGNSAVKVGTYIQLSGGIGPDGLALLGDGRLVVAHPGTGAVWVFDECGIPQLRIRTPDGRMPTNIAIKRESEVVITESETATIYIADLPS